MKIFRQISHNWEKYQVNILRQFNIEAKEGNCRFNMNDANTYSKLASFFRDWDVLDTLGFEFSKNEILVADYCVIDRWNLFGYPMPDNDMGYLYNTYDTKDMCGKCGIGKIQKDDFRVMKVPKYPLWGLGWIFDEFFVRTDFYEKIFKPLGIECRPLRKYKDDSIIETYVQLVIPVINEPLNLSTYDSELCPNCGMAKYNPKTHGYYPLQEHPLPYIYKSKEYFGSGFRAFRRIYVSSYLRDLMIENKMLRIRDFVPCAKSEELSIKNQGMMEWLNTGRNNKDDDIANFIVAVPDKKE